MGNEDRASDRVIAALAERQHSLVTSAGLIGAGLGRDDIDYRVRMKLLHVVHRGVYRMPGVRPYWEEHVMAACLAAGGFASHRTAAALFGLRGFRPGPVEITVDRGKAPILDGVVCHRSKGITGTTIGVIPVTFPDQILLDVAGVAPRLAEGALNDALVRKLVTAAKMVRFLHDRSRSGRPGGVRLRELVEAHVKGARPTESWLEDRLIEFLREYGFPEPERQYPVLLPGRRRPIRLDCAYPGSPLDLEADGRLWHTSPAQVRADAERDQFLRVLGWQVLRVTWLELVESPDELAGRIARVLGVKRAA